MDDDFNTAGAVAVLFEALTTVNRFMDDEGLDERKAGAEHLEALETFAATLRALGGLLGVFEKPVGKPGFDEETLARLREIVADTGGDVDMAADGGGLVEKLIARRAAARAAKDFNTADDIRQRLSDAGIILEDRLGGTTWSRAT